MTSSDNDLLHTWAQSHVTRTCWPNDSDIDVHTHSQMMSVKFKGSKGKFKCVFERGFFVLFHCMQTAAVYITYVSVRVLFNNNIHEFLKYFLALEPTEWCQSAPISENAPWLQNSLAMNEPTCIHPSYVLLFLCNIHVTSLNPGHFYKSVRFWIWKPIEVSSKEYSYLLSTATCEH